MIEEHKADFISRAFKIISPILPVSFCHLTTNVSLGYFDFTFVYLHSRLPFGQEIERAFLCL
jgi:hypothetical protein